MKKQWITGTIGLDENGNEKYEKITEKNEISIEETKRNLKELENEILDKLQNFEIIHGVSVNEIIIEKERYIGKKHTKVNYLSIYLQL